MSFLAQKPSATILAAYGPTGGASSIPRILRLDLNGKIL